MWYGATASHPPYGASDHIYGQSINWLLVNCTVVHSCRESGFIIHMLMSPDRAGREHNMRELGCERRAEETDIAAITDSPFQKPR